MTHGQDLVNAHQIQDPGDRRLRTQQLQLAALVSQGARGLCQGGDRRGVGEPQPGQVHRQKPRVGPQLLVERAVQLVESGQVRFAGQDDDRSGFAGFDGDLKQTHNGIPHRGPHLFNLSARAQYVTLSGR